MWLLSWGTGKQVLLSGADPCELVALRDALNAALLRAMGRPLKPLEPNVLALQATALPCQAIARNVQVSRGTD